MKIAIWDIDNCIADDAPRHHLIDWDKQGDARYARYNEASLSDRAAHIREFNLMLALGCAPVFFTGRPEYTRRIAEAWLYRNYGLFAPTMLMRANGTVGLTPVVLKERMLAQYVGGPYEIVAAFDDLPGVVDMYRYYGIAAVQLAINDPTLAYEKSDLAPRTMAHLPV